mmetsp:Transcript_8201/g.30398  ORF Transcript_8201/g.30398 Transcript_8201/m.30398 type:complete len:200 (-) Transcript_8201:236-835(-)
MPTTQARIAFKHDTIGLGCFATLRARHILVLVEIFRVIAHHVHRVADRENHAFQIYHFPILALRHSHSCSRDRSLLTFGRFCILGGDDERRRRRRRRRFRLCLGRLGRPRRRESRRRARRFPSLTLFFHSPLLMPPPWQPRVRLCFFPVPPIPPRTPCRESLVSSSSSPPPSSSSSSSQPPLACASPVVPHPPSHTYAI